MVLETSKDLNFIKYGKLNMLCIRNGKDVEKVAADTPAFLNDERVVKGLGMDLVTFQPNVVFKVTLDFKKPLPCVEGTAVREGTDWVLCSCMGSMAHFNKVEERLVLQQCVVSIQSNVDPLVAPFHLVLFFDDDEWQVERVYR